MSSGPEESSPDQSIQDQAPNSSLAQSQKKDFPQVSTKLPPRKIIIQFSTFGFYTAKKKIYSEDVVRSKAKRHLIGIVSKVQWESDSEEDEDEFLEFELNYRGIEPSLESALILGEVGWSGI